MKNIGSYPSVRLRRNRKSDWSRRLVQENNLSPNDLIWPIFIKEGKNQKIVFYFFTTSNSLKLVLSLSVTLNICQKQFFEKK